MADPVIPGGIRVQFIIPGLSGLAEDRFVTTWAFRTESGLPPTPVNLADAINLVGSFFAEPSGTGGAPIATFLGFQCDNANAEGRAYRLGDPPPREPFILPKPLPAASSTGMPSEVAIVASFYGTRNLPRRRGRVYIGPLSASPAMFDNSGTIPRPRPSVMVTSALQAASARLQQQAVALQLRWCVLSQRDAALVPITAGWVDDAWDTQRRRGEQSQIRRNWTS
jgi:hypothetical protein